MDNIKTFWQNTLKDGLNNIKTEGTADILLEDVAIETPPKEELGDLALPLFPFALIFKISPAKIA